MNLTRSPRSKKKVYDHWAYPNLGVPRSKYGSRKTTRGGPDWDWVMVRKNR